MKNLKISEIKNITTIGRSSLGINLTTYHDANNLVTNIQVAKNMQLHSLPTHLLSRNIWSTLLSLPTLSASYKNSLSPTCKGEQTELTIKSSPSLSLSIQGFFITLSWILGHFGIHGTTWLAISPIKVQPWLARNIQIYHQDVVPRIEKSISLQRRHLLTPGFINIKPKKING